MSTRPERQAQPIAPEELLSVLEAGGRPSLYLSRGFGPRPQLRTGEAPEHVRVALIPGASFAEVQAARARWAATLAELVPVDGPEADPGEVAAPAADSPWAAIADQARAAVLTGGVEALATIRPELAVFHLTSASGGSMLLPRVRAIAAGEGPPLDLVILEHVLYAVLTHRTLRFQRPALVMTAGSTWSIRQVFPDHATVWRQAMIEAPSQALGGLALSQLAELLVRAFIARRSGTEGPASAPAIVAALTAAEAVIAPWISNLLGEGDRPPARN